MSSFIKYLPPYYNKSRVMNEVLNALEQEYERLKTAVQITENQFFVLLADKNIANHEQDAGLIPDLQSDIETRRGRILSRLRGTGTVTKSMIKNVAGSFINGEVEVIEYPDRYTFAIKFVSKKGIPVNLDDIKIVIEDIKPAHLAVEYIFTYRLWQDALSALADWDAAKSNSWEWMRSFEIVMNLYITDDGLVYYRSTNDGNAYIAFINGKPAAKRTEG